MDNLLFLETLRYSQYEFLQAFFGSHGVAKHHWESYNRSLKKDIPLIIKQIGCMKTKLNDFYIIYSVVDCRIHRPEHTPLECQKQNITYCGRISATIIRHVYARKKGMSLDDLFFKDAQSKKNKQSMKHQLAHKQQCQPPFTHPPRAKDGGASAPPRSENATNATSTAKGKKPDTGTHSLVIGEDLKTLLTEDVLQDARRSYARMKAREKSEYTWLVESTKYSNVKITDWPCMVNSDLCLLRSKEGKCVEYPDTHKSRSYDDYNRLEHGGHFIVNGKPRFIPLIKSTACNNILCFYVSGKKRWIAQYRAQSEKRKFQSTHTLEVYLEKEQKLSKKTTIAFAPMVSIPYFSNPVSLRVLVLAMGRSVQEFWNDVRALTPRRLWDEEKFCKYFNGLRFSNFPSISSKEEAIELLGMCYGRYQSDNAGHSAIFCEVFPNMNHSGGKMFEVCSSEEYDARQKELNTRKTQLLAQCLSNLMLCAEGIVPPVDKDSRDLVRYVDSGTSMSVLLRMQLSHVMSQSLKILRRFYKDGRDVDLCKIYNSRRLWEKIIQCVATGTWTSMRKGVCQSLNTNNQAVIRSQLRRISSNVTEGMHLARRMLHGSSFGYECAAETPEGRSCGLVGQLACTADVTLQFDNAGAVDAITSFFSEHREVLPPGTFLATPFLPLQAPAPGGEAQGSGGEEGDDDERRCMCLRGFRRRGALDTLRGTFLHICAGDAGRQVLVSNTITDLVCRCVMPTPSNSTCTEEWWKVVGPAGSVVGWTSRPWLAREMLREARRLGVFHRTISICVDPTLQTVRLESDAGRLCRPLLCADWFSKPFSTGLLVAELQLTKKMGCSPSETLHHLFQLGVFEYITPSEEKNLRPSFDWELPRQDHRQVTHLEITNASIVGKQGVRIPLMTRSQGPRIAYSLGMMKQTIIGDSVDRGGNRSYRLVNAQRPLISTAIDQIEGGARSREFTNVVMAVLALPGCQEDAIVVNRSFLDMGGFAMSSARWYTSEIGAESTSRSNKSKKAKQRSAQFTRPDPKTTRLRQDAIYDHLDKNGLPKKGSFLTDRHGVIGKTYPMTYLSSGAKVSAPDECFKAKSSDQSVLLKKNERGRVASAEIHVDPEKGQTAKVLVTSFHDHANQGDKFTSRHAQKGTIGRIVDPEDLPFDPVTGIIPDVVFSPLGITSRMTMSTILELFFGLTVSATGELLHGLDEQDYEGSMEKRIQAMGEALKRAGFASSGKAVMVHGETGERIHVPIYRGVVSYARLHQLVDSKKHARGAVGKRGPCRQPTEGKARDGGHRFGEMEINILIAHGAWNTLQERLVLASDPFDIYVCTKCSNPSSSGNPMVHFYHCDVCGTGEFVTPVQISWSTKCVVQELMAQKVQVKFHVERSSF